MELPTTFERVNIPYRAILAVEACRTAMVAKAMRLIDAPPAAIKSWVLAKSTRPERAN